MELSPIMVICTLQLLHSKILVIKEDSLLSEELSLLKFSIWRFFFYKTLCFQFPGQTQEGPAGCWSQFSCWPVEELCCSLDFTSKHCRRKELLRSVRVQGTKYRPRLRSRILVVKVHIIGHSTVWRILCNRLLSFTSVKYLIVPCFVTTIMLLDLPPLKLWTSPTSSSQNFCNKSYVGLCLIKEYVRKGKIH